MVIVDATLIKTERPTKKQRAYYSGKHKAHGVKLQIVINHATKEILNLAFANGKTHDFELFRKNRQWLSDDVLVMGDLGYLGIHKIHARSLIPYKKPKGGCLSKLQNAENSELASHRIAVEHVFRFIKSFKILGTRYRNRRRKIGLRSTIIAMLFNELHAI